MGQGKNTSMRRSNFSASSQSRQQQFAHWQWPSMKEQGLDGALREQWEEAGKNFCCAFDDAIVKILYRIR